MLTKLNEIIAALAVIYNMYTKHIKKRRNKSFIYRKVYTDRSWGRGGGTRKKDRIEIVGE